MQNAEGVDLLYTSSKSLHVNDLHELVQVVKGQGVINEEEGGPATTPPGGAAGSPSLSDSNICNEEVEGRINKLTGGHRRMAFVITLEIMALGRGFGVWRLGFLTLTFKDLVLNLREAQRRFHSLVSGVLNGRYKRCIGVWERMKSGRLHCHLVVVLDQDIRTGFDFSKIGHKDWRKNDYSSANLALRAEWAFWRKTAPMYGFGRVELLPVRSTAEGIAKYVGKYVAKHIDRRNEDDKGKRIVRFIGFSEPGARKASAKFGWNSNGAKEWRLKIEAYARLHGAETYEEFVELFGNKWAYRLYEQIMAMDVYDVSPVNEWVENQAVTSARIAIEKAINSGRGRVYDIKVVNPQAVTAWRMAGQNEVAREIAFPRGKEWVRKLPGFKSWMADRAAGPRIGKAVREAGLQASEKKWGLL